MIPERPNFKLEPNDGYGVGHAEYLIINNNLKV